MSLNLSATLFITLITVAITIWGWRDKKILDKFIFHPFTIKRDKQYWRFLTAAFLHGDIIHLAFNMISFYSFGGFLESFFEYHYGIWGGRFIYLGYYLLAAIVASIYSFEKNKKNSSYYALGASGAVSAVVFSAIFIEPTSKLLIMGIIPAPGFIYAIIFLVLSAILAKKGRDNIGHDAHFFGALFGVAFILILQPGLLKDFFVHIRYYFLNLF